MKENLFLLFDIISMSEFHDLVARGNDFKTFRELLKKGKNPNFPDAKGNTPLHVAAFKEVENEQDLEANLQIARELIYFGADLNHQNNLGNTPLHFAVARRNHKMMEILLFSKADIDIQDSFGNSALHYAINNKHLLQKSDYLAYPSFSDLKAVELLMNFRPSVNIHNYRFETPLIWAVEQQNFQIVKTLLDKGALHSLRGIHGNGVLHYALDQTEINVKIVTELIRRGSSHDSKNDQVMSPVDVYLKRLKTASSIELEKAKYLFKLFVFQQNTFRSTHFRDIAVISRKKRKFLCQFFWYCRFEIEQLKSDELSYDYTIYDLASWGFYSFFSAVRPPLPEVFPVALDKLKNGEYPVYGDMIISGISKQYLAFKIAETRYWTNKKGEREEFLNYDTRFYLCYFLTKLEIFNFHLAFSTSGSIPKSCKMCNLFY